MSYTIIAEDKSASPQRDLLCRDWCKAQIKAGRDPYQSGHLVTSLKLSKNEEWVVISTNEFSALAPAQSTIGTTLIGIMEQVRPVATVTSYLAKFLMVVPQKKGKLGFAIAISDDEMGRWRWKKDDEYFHICRDKAPVEETTTLFTLEDLNPSPALKASENAQTPTRAKRTSPKPNEAPTAS